MDLPAYIQRKKDAAAKRAAELAFFEKLWQLESIDPDDWQVVHTAYRLTRLVARVKGIVVMGETLESGTKLTTDPWLQPVGKLTEKPPSEVPALLDQAGSLAVPLSPPPLTDPQQRMRWRRVFETAADRLQMGQDPASRLILMGLMDHLDQWPSPRTLMDWEYALLTEGLDMLIENGYVEAGRFLRKTYGLHHWEALEILAMSMTSALASTMSSVDVARALQYLRLEDLLSRCKKEADHKTELAVLKAINQLRGLDAEHSDVQPILQAMEEEIKDVEYETNPEIEEGN
jgi:hypothetical protein